jgi:hypothetical protein
VITEELILIVDELSLAEKPAISQEFSS